ncbi:MAG: class I tRNA ligase family protein, partial [Patescibacteria group bacterium]
DPAFGTGVMTITPWHDHVDFDLAERHGLEKEQIIGFDGKLLPIAGECAGLPIEEARPKVVETLKAKGLLVKVDENYVHRVAVSYRGKGIVEPQIKEQWFIDVNKPVVSWKRKKISLKQIMQEVVRTKLITIIPERFEKVYFHWIDNLRDWCISRQIYWGHRVPVWYRRAEGSMDIHVGALPPEGDEWQQDPDTLDTWFSAGLWTWSTLVDPALAEQHDLSLDDLLKKSPDFQKFHPTQVMETGYDILFFWVARMILMTTYATGDIPFETVYLHGLIRTREGKKMSKSDPETMIDPLDIIPKYGADALRLSMIVGQSPGADSRLYEEKIAGYRNFVNKLWNASRFVLMQCNQEHVDPKSVQLHEKELGDNLSLSDGAILFELENVIDYVQQGLGEFYKPSSAAEELYRFVWDSFCDWYLEFTKTSPNITVLIYVLRQILIILHPFCPFVTEEIWSHVKPYGSDLLIKQSWPTNPFTNEQELSFADASRKFHRLQEIIIEIRKLRSGQNVEAGKRVNVLVYTSVYAKLLEEQAVHIKRLARVGELTIEATPRKLQNVISTFLPDMEIRLSLEGLIDVEKEKKSLMGEKEHLEKIIASTEQRLNKQEFVTRAPAAVVESEKEKVRTMKVKVGKMEERLRALQ